MTTDLRAQLQSALGCSIRTSCRCTVQQELEALLPHPRLGPLVRQLSLFVQRPEVAHSGD